MTAKQALSRPAAIHRQICFESESLATLRAVAERCTQQLDLAGCHMAKGERGLGEDRILCLEEKEAALKEKVSAFAEAERKALDLIDLLEDEMQRKVLMLRYIAGMPYRDIAKKLYMSAGNAHRLHREGLKRITELGGFEREKNWRNPDRKEMKE